MLYDELERVDWYLRVTDRSRLRSTGGTLVWADAGGACGGDGGVRASRSIERCSWGRAYKQRVAALDEVTTLPVEVRERMAAEGFGVGLPEIVQAAKSVDGTERYLMRMADGETVETVWMPDGDGGERGDGSEAAAEEAG